MAIGKTARPAGANGLGSGLGPERVVEIQRRRILAATVDACLELGCVNVAVANVVERAGISRRTFYELFGDRQECFLAAFDDGIDRASRSVLADYAPERKWVERVRRALLALLAFLDAERGIARILIVDSLSMGAPVLARREQVVAKLVALVDEGRKDTKHASGLAPVMAEGIVGGALSVLCSRLLWNDDRSLLELAGSLMNMIVLPYCGVAVARRELERPIPESEATRSLAAGNPLCDLEMRLTYRTVRVLLAIAESPRASNRQVAVGAGISDQGQISKLLSRLGGLGLVENVGLAYGQGGPNSWTLTDRGSQVAQAMSAHNRILPGERGAA